MKNIGEKIKKRREELKITQDQLAAMVGYKHKSSINKIEAGLRDVPRKNLEIFAKALNVSVEWLIVDTSTLLPDDTELLTSMPYLAPKQELPPELEAVNILLANSGKHIMKSNNKYYLDEAGELTEEEVNELLNNIVISVKNATDAIVAKKMQEFKNFLQSRK